MVALQAEFNREIRFKKYSLDAINADQNNWRFISVNIETLKKITDILFQKTI